MAALLQGKDSWFEEEVNRHYLKFTTKKDINIFIGTWNVNAKEPKDSIDSWLFDSNNKFSADIYVLGFQEIVDLNAANLWIENTANEGWEKMISESLATNIRKEEFIQISSRHLVGILLCVYVRKSLRSKIKNIMTSIVGVGLFGTAGNKGGVGIRMQVYDSDICFICTHLAAHKNNVQGRNQDYLKIIQNMRFSPSGNNNNNNNNNEEKQENNNNNNNENDNKDNNNNNNNDNKEEEEEEEMLSVISDHDMVFWLGDLNYRLNLDDLDSVFKKINEKDWKYLLTHDQLNIERAKRSAFGGFIENNIDFDPTYKFQPGTNKYEQRPDKKKRFPAWCDRILWRRGTKKTTRITDVNCLLYWISMEQTMSDHKPVYAYLKYSANIFDIVKRSEMRKQIMKNKDKNDNNKLPQIEIDPEVQFPLIKFGETEQKKFIIHNTGQVAVSFRFTHADHKQSLPKWLSINPNKNLIRPGEKKTIIFEICINSQIIKLIQSSNYKLEETVLLRIENTSDKVVPMKFIIVSAKYLISCFGNKIENLIKYKKPIRYIDDMNMKSNDNEALSIPKELWRLIDHLYKYGMDCESIFIQRGINTEISEIRECLDTGKAFSRYELHSVGEALVRFLESLQEPVFPVSLCNTLNDKNDNNNKDVDIAQWCRQVLMRLSLSHYNTFIYTISFLREVLKHSSRNKLTPEKLAYQFSSALMQSPVKDVTQLSNFKPFKILRHFLSSDLFL